MSELKVFDAFSGIGGFRRGLETSETHAKKFRFVASTDSDPTCRSVYQKLFSNHKEKIFEDINHVHTSENPTKNFAPDFDLFLAGFPCQPFANIGHRRGFDDERGILIFQICNLLKYYQPKYFILENVQKMRNLGKGDTLAKVEKMLKDAGYSLCIWDLCASDYGVPQQRRRLIFCGVKDTKAQILDLATPKKVQMSDRRYPSTWHLLEKQMPEEHLIPTKTAETVFRSNPKWQGDLKINRLVARPLTATMAKWHRANQDNYFCEDFVFSKSFEEAAACATEPNSRSVRRISLLEGLRLQGFDDTAYNVFKETRLRPTPGFRLIGNAIPVSLVKCVAEEFFSAV
jgi:DNA (cytosine-5)-methyltransferase 1